MFVIEHMEDKLYKWCRLEYAHIAKITGNDVIFTSMKAAIPGLKCDKRQFTELGLKNVCVLDPFAAKMLSSDDKYDYYVFGGILGDEPMQGRSREIPGKVRRNLGTAQMSTDTAVYVAKHILDGGRMDDLKFRDEIEIEIDDGESMILPFRYVLVQGQPMLPKGLAEHLKKGF